MKKVIVTGALGFIGFHLCNQLLEEGVEVYGIDCLLDKSRRNIQEEMLQFFVRNDQFHFINKKIEDVNFDQIGKVDVIFHLAAATKVDAQWTHLRETIHHNVKSTKKIIQTCNKPTRIVYASTIQVYGERYGLVTEETPTNPITPYGLTKLAGESILFQDGKKNNVEVIVLRLPTVYGPWQRPDMTYYQLLADKYMGKKELIDTDRFLEDVVFIDDVVGAFLLAAKVKVINQVFNITSSRHNDWYKGVELLTGKKVVRNQNERLTVRISNDKAQKVLGFSNQTSLNEGIKKQEDHFKKMIKRVNE